MQWLHSRIHQQSGSRTRNRPVENVIVSILPVLGSTPMPQKMKWTTCLLLLLSGWQDFLNSSPGSTLKHEVLQVKFGACAICRCEQTTSSLLNAFICQGGVVKVLLDHSLGMANIEQVKEADDNGTMLVEKIFLQQVIHDRVRK